MIDYRHIKGQSVPFYPAGMVASFDRLIPVLCKSGAMRLSRDWPPAYGTQQHVFEQLRDCRQSWLRSWQKDATTDVQVFVLVGNYQIKLNIQSNAQGAPQFWLNSIAPAKNQDRASMLKEGVRVSHRGLCVLPPDQMGVLQRQDANLQNGLLVRDLVNLTRNESNRIARPQAADTQMPAKPSEGQLAIVEAVRVFIDAEYELEVRAAQQEPSYAFTKLTPLSRSTVYRQFYALELIRPDYKRMLEKKPGLLALKCPAEQQDQAPVFQVAELEPEPNSPVIHVSIEKQTVETALPPAGELVLQAMPTLQKVRSDVLDKLIEQESANPWLIRVVADEYENPPFAPVVVKLPESKNPPTASQMKAIIMGASTPDYCLVLGPPGTGKTTVILSWVRHFVSQGLRVLVTSQNNKAVDNVLERLAEEKEFECIRIGSETKVSSTLMPILLDNKARDLQQKLFAKGDIALENLRLWLDYLGRLLAGLPKIGAMQQQSMQARAQVDQRKFQIKKLSDSSALLRTQGLDEEKKIAGSVSRIEEIRTRKWSFLDGIQKAFGRMQIKRINDQLTKMRESLQKVVLEFRQCQSQIGQFSSELKALEVTAELAAADLAKLLSGSPESLIDELKLPEDGELSAHSLSELAQRVSGLHKSVNEWFTRLRNERQQDLYKILMENVNVVGATCIGINTNKLFRDIAFDVVIVDEAGQIQIHNIAVPLSRAPKVILVGDHKQLPPIVQDEIVQEIEARGAGDNAELYAKSWFENMWDRTPQDRRVILDTQFRCPKPISDFVSAAFYDGDYHAGAGMEKKQSILSFCVGPMAFVDTQHVNNRRESSVQNGDRMDVAGNELETTIVVDLLERAVAERPELAEKREIGVIVPYAKHVEQIRAEIARRRKNGQLHTLNCPLHELVASVDSFQGQERDLIIFPFTRSNEGGAIGFLADWRRLNVAVTRTKKQLIMVGDLRTLTAKPKPNTAGFKTAMVTLEAMCRSSGWLMDATQMERPPQNDTRQWSRNAEGSRA